MSQRVVRFVRLHPCLPATGFLWALLACLYSNPRPGPDFDQDRVVDVQGWISSGVRSGEDVSAFEMTPTLVRQGQRSIAVPASLSVFVPRSPGLSPTPFRYGQRIRTTTWLRDPSLYLVPGVKDGRALTWSYGISYYLYLKSPLQIEILDGEQGSLVRRVLERYRMQFVAFCEARLSREQDQLIRSAFLGEKGILSEETRQSVRRLGIFHLFVVSGLHVGLLLGGMHALVRRWGTRGRILSLLAMWCYIVMVGPGLSTVRAGLMSTLAYLLMTGGRRQQLLNTLGLVGIVVLALQPEAARMPGLQFAFLSLLAIGLLSERLRHACLVVRRGLRVWHPEVTTSRGGLDRAVRRLRFLLEDRLDILPHSHCARVLPLFGSLGALILGLVGSALGVQVATLPIVLYYSNYWIWSQWWTNLLLVPLFTLLIPACFFLLLTFCLPVGEVALWASAGLSYLIVQLLSLLDESPVLTFLPHPRPWEIATYFAILLVGLLFRRLLVPTLLAAPLFLYLTLTLPPSTLEGRLQVTMLDVGQGEAIHLRYPDGTSALVDTGGMGFGSFLSSDFVGERLVGRYLWQERVKGLQFVLLTHPHLDHIQGFDFLKRAFPVGSVYFHDKHDSYAHPGALELQKGDHFTVAGVHHTVLHPPRQGHGSRTANDASLVLLLRFGRFSILLSGDIEVEAESELSPMLEPVTVLKVPHHGSRTSTSKQLLSRTRPLLALISAGRRNRFGHPADQTLERLTEHGVDVLVTSRRGSLRVESDGECWSAGEWDPLPGSFQRRYGGCLSGPTR